MDVNLRVAKWAPWSALVAGMLAEIAHHQVLSDMLRFDCRRGGPGPGIVGGVVALLVIGAGIALSRASVRGVEREAPHARNRRFIASLSTWTAALLAVAIVWQTLATVIVPGCAR